MSNPAPLVRLQDVADLNPALGAIPPGDEVVSFLPMSAVEADSVDAVDVETRRFGDVGKGYTPFLSGDVLVAKITPCFENGKIALAKPTRRFGFGSTEFHVVRAHRDRLDARYLAHFMRQPRIRLEGERKMTGSAGQRRVPEHFLSTLAIPLPPLPEQRRIADILDKADALRAKRRTALAQLDTLTQSIFLDMFGDPATNPKGWPNIALGDALIAIRNGTNAEQQEDPAGWPITRIETIAAGTINPDRVRWVSADPSLVENFQLAPGDILFSHINSVDHIAKTALYSGTPTRLIHGINLLRLRPRLECVEPVWLLHLLKHEAVRTHFRTRCKRAVNQASLNQTDIKSLSTYLPPLSLQRAFANRITAVDNLKLVQSGSLTAHECLFATLQHRAFQGEL
ncbi:MAG: hypothetical protein IOMNBAOH_00395 [Rhodocyclaceae bacterium]|nr:hypothetical protein [Rhodocyclaceae bacterium]